MPRGTEYRAERPYCGPPQYRCRRRQDVSTIRIVGRRTAVHILDSRAMCVRMRQCNIAPPLVASVKAAAVRGGGVCLSYSASIRSFLRAGKGRRAGGRAAALRYPAHMRAYVCAAATVRRGWGMADMVQHSAGSLETDRQKRGNLPSMAASCGLALSDCRAESVRPYDIRARGE